VVVVSKRSGLNGLLETVLDSGRYDVVVVESTEHAYTHIKRVNPHLVIVCLDIDDLDGFQVLSMLKLDSETRNIPVVTCTVSVDEPPAADDAADESGDEMFPEAGPMYMN
jgi:DNA-binding response OmpR family regulator